MSEAETTFILVDHSDSMAAESKQNEAWGDVNHYYNNLASESSYSISYFGGDNGGDCKSEVAIVGPVAKASSTLKKTALSAGGDNPLLGAIDTIHSKHGSDPIRIVVISDFDAVCGTTKSACMAVRGYRADNPNFEFVFEPIGGDSELSPLYKCLTAIQPVERPFILPKIEIDLQVSAGGSGGAVMQPPKLPTWVLFASWFISIAFIFVILLDAALFLTWFQVSTEDTEGLDGSAETETNDRPTLKTITIVASVLTVLFFVALVWFLMYQFLAMVWVWSLIHHWANMRFGAAFFSTILAGYFAWTAFTLWSAGMKRLSNRWVEKFNASKLTNELSILKTSNSDELSSARNMFDSYKPLLNSDSIMRGDLLLADLNIAFDAILSSAKSELENDGLKKWKRRNFKQADKLVDHLQKEYSLEQDQAQALKKSFNEWRQFEKDLPSLAEGSRKENEEDRSVGKESDD